MNELGLLAGPRCRAPRVRRDDTLICSAAGCAHACEGFAKLGGKPVLIDSERSTVDRRAFFVSGRGDHIDRNVISRWRTYSMVKRLAGANRDAAENSELFPALLKARRPRPVVVTVGGATREPCSDQFWIDPQMELTSFDIHDSTNAHLLADAHYVPLLEGSADRVWIQAVLEHVLEPAQVVAAIHRMLRAEGLV